MRPEQHVEHMVRARPGVHGTFMATHHTPSITRVEAELGERRASRVMGATNGTLNRTSDCSGSPLGGLQCSEINAFLASDLLEQLKSQPLEKEKQYGDTKGGDDGRWPLVADWTSAIEETKQQLLCFDGWEEDDSDSVVVAGGAHQEPLHGEPDMVGLGPEQGGHDHDAADQPRTTTCVSGKSQGCGSINELLSLDRWSTTPPAPLLLYVATDPAGFSGLAFPWDPNALGLQPSTRRRSLPLRQQPSAAATTFDLYIPLLLPPSTAPVAVVAVTATVLLFPLPTPALHKLVASPHQHRVVSQHSQ
ncbi:hypothetical protein BHE74_00020989 [Ensete ventricosum]|nr:hypothetical protein BHE74_00020989 [Ensete ventricosum]